jgi:hypothetical protein
MPSWVCAGATSLALEDSPLLGHGLAAVCARLDGLRAILLRNCLIGDADMASALHALASAGACSSAARSGPRLDTLRLAYCHGIADGAVDAATRSFPHLSRVELASCGRLVLPTGSAGNGTVQITRELPPHAHVATQQERGPPLTDAALHALASRCAGLRALSVSGCQFFTDEGVSTVLRGCPLLTELDVSKCTMLDGSFMRALTSPAVAARLTVLLLDGVGSAEQAAAGCRSNAMAAFSAVAAPDVQSGAHAGEARRDAPAAGLGASSFGVTVGEAPVESGGGPSATAGEATSIPNAGGGWRSMGPAFPALITFSLGWCPWLDDATAAVVGASLACSTHLQHLSLHACAALSAAGVRAFRDAAPHPGHLRHLDIAQIPALQDREVASLLAGLSGLEALDISGCSKVGSAAYAAIGSHCPRLRVLGSRLTVRVDGDAVQALATAVEERRAAGAA